MEPAACRQPPSYRQAIVNHHVTSRQSRSDMTTCDVYMRAESRGVDRPHTARNQGGAFVSERVRSLMSHKMVDRELYQRPGWWSASCIRPTIMAAGTCSLPRDVNCDRGHEAHDMTATSRLFSAASQHHSPSQFHESSYSAPADLTSHHRRPHPRSTFLPCGPGVRATKVSVRTAYHLTSTHRPTVTSSFGQRSRLGLGGQQGSCLWVGVAQTVDIRPVSASALTATVDYNNRKFCTPIAIFLSYILVFV